MNPSLGATRLLSASLRSIWMILAVCLRQQCAGRVDVLPARADLHQSLRLACEFGVCLRHGELSGVLRDVLLAGRPGKLFQLLVPRVIAPGLVQRRLPGGGLGLRLGDLLRP